MYPEYTLLCRSFHWSDYSVTNALIGTKLGRLFDNETKRHGPQLIFYYKSMKALLDLIRNAFLILNRSFLPIPRQKLLVTAVRYDLNLTFEPDYDLRQITASRTEDSFLLCSIFYD